MDHALIHMPATPELPARDLLLIRPPTNTRVVIDIDPVQPIDLGPWRHAAEPADLASAPPETRRILLAIIDDERRRAELTLQYAPALLRIIAEAPRPGAADHARDPLIIALRTVTFHRRRDLEPILRNVERSSHVDPSISRAVREALRAGGHTPIPGLGATTPVVPRPAWPVGAAAASPTTAQRVERAPRITAGTTVDDLKSLLGDPDARVDLRGV